MTASMSVCACLFTAGTARAETPMRPVMAREEMVEKRMVGIREKSWRM